MRRECVVDSSVGDGLGFLIAAPSILFGTMAVTGVLFALTVSLVQRAWSVYAAIGAAVLAAAVVVAVAVSCVYDTGTATTPARTEFPISGGRYRCEGMYSGASKTDAMRRFSLVEMEGR